MIDSESRAGNIGMPSGHEAKKHLRKMLATTTQNLSLEQIDLLVENIEN